MKSNHEYRRTAYELVKNKIFDILVPLLVFSFITGIISSVGTSFGPQYNNDTFPPVLIDQGNPTLLSIFNFLNLIIAAYVAYASLVMFIQVTQDKRPDVEDVLLAGIKEQPIKAPILTLITSLLIGLWSLLFIIPGIVKAYAFSLSTYILIQNKEIKVIDAIKESESVMKGKKSQLFLLDLSYFGWYLLSLLTLGILLIWVIPRHQTARTLFFIDAYQSTEAR
jgi:uncharacterized membrane protein